MGLFYRLNFIPSSGARGAEIVINRDPSIGAEKAHSRKINLRETDESQSLRRWGLAINLLLERGGDLPVARGIGRALIGEDVVEGGEVAKQGVVAGR